MTHKRLFSDFISTKNGVKSTSKLQATYFHQYNVNFKRRKREDKYYDI